MSVSDQILKQILDTLNDNSLLMGQLTAEMRINSSQILNIKSEVNELTKALAQIVSKIAILEVSLKTIERDMVSKMNYITKDIEKLELYNEKEKIKEDEKNIEEKKEQVDIKLNNNNNRVAVVLGIISFLASLLTALLTYLTGK